jgi:hypothetical protein
MAAISKTNVQEDVRWAEQGNNSSRFGTALVQNKKQLRQWRSQRKDRGD